MRIAITGATGFIGPRLCAALAERGDELVVLSRDPDRARGQLPGIAEAVAWNPTEGLPPPIADCRLPIARSPESGKSQIANRKSR
jgi:nucleoside-diphosphate-sugar epimerase